MHAKENDDNRRYTIPLFLGDNLSKSLIVTKILYLFSFALKI